MAEPGRQSTVRVQRHKRLGSSEWPVAFESYLSAGLPVTVEELDAIVRLLGDDLKSLLSEVCAAGYALRARPP